MGIGEGARLVHVEEEPWNSVTSRKFHCITLEVTQNERSKVPEVDQDQDGSKDAASRMTCSPKPFVDRQGIEHNESVHYEGKAK